MASSLVDLIVRVSGAAAATSAFGRIGAALGGLGRASGQTQSLTGAIASGIIQANLLGQALSLVGNAASFMGGKFEEAKTIEMGDVSAASTFAALTGKSFQESSKFVSDFSKEISLVAGALPGATKDYNMVANSIMDNVIPAFKDANGVLDQGKFKDNLVDISKKMTLMGISSGTNAQAVGMFTARLLDGNVASAKQLLFADNNPAFMAKFKEALEKQGKTEKDFKTMTSKQRLELIQAVSGEFISKDVIDAASNTVDGLMAGIESSLFDPKSGIFGLLRDLSGAEGNQTVMTAVAAGIKAVMGFFDEGAYILQALGVPSVDPMLVLYNGINTFTGWVNQAAYFAGIIGDLIKSSGGGLQGLVTIATQFLDPSRIMAGLGNFLGQVMPLINSLFANLASSTGSFLSGGGGSVGFAVMGAKLGIFGGQLVGKLIQFIINLPWGNILISIGNLALAAIPFVVGLIAGFRATVLLEIGKGLLSIGGKLLEGLNILWVAANYTISEWWSSFVGGWAEVGSFAITSGQNFFTSLGSAIADMWNQLLSAITGAIGNVVSQAQSTISAPVTAISAAVSNVVSNPIGTVGSAVTNVGQTAFNLGQNIGSGAGKLLGFYKGHIPTASGGLLGAFATESRNMPSGASPVVANSSEWILRPDQAKRLMQGAASVGSTSQSPAINFSPVFNISGATDPKAIAAEVLQQLEILFSNYQDSVLA